MLRCLAYLGRAHRTGSMADKGWYNGFPSSSGSMECFEIEEQPKEDNSARNSRVEFDYILGD